MVDTNECKEASREGMLEILRGFYSFSESFYILQAATENDFYEDDYIQILKSLCYPDLFYYTMKRVPEWY